MPLTLTLPLLLFAPPPLKDMVVLAFADELWDYSHSNLEIFAQAQQVLCNGIANVTLRYIPPGYVPESWDIPEPPTSSDGKVGWLGNLRCDSMLGAWMREHWTPTHAWGPENVARELRTHLVWGSMHQNEHSCNFSTAALESFRLSQLLSSGRIVVSELSHVEDMAEYEGAGFV